MENATRRATCLSFQGKRNIQLVMSERRTGPHFTSESLPPSGGRTETWESVSILLRGRPATESHGCDFLARREVEKPGGGTCTSYKGGTTRSTLRELRNESTVQRVEGKGGRRKKIEGRGVFLLGGGSEFWEEILKTNCWLVQREAWGETQCDAYGKRCLAAGGEEGGGNLERYRKKLRP